MTPEGKVVDISYENATEPWFKENIFFFLLIRI